MGSNLSSARRSSADSPYRNEDDATITKLKANIRPPTGLIIMNGDDSLGSSRNGTMNGNGLDSNNFIRNRKELLSMRSSKYSPKGFPAPMPSSDELEKRFTKVLVSLSFSRRFKINRSLVNYVHESLCFDLSVTNLIICTVQ